MTGHLQLARWLALAAIAYLLGSIPSGYWLGKLWKGVDVRQFGSGNLGAANVFRVLGPLPGLLTFFVDMAKGWISIFLARRLFPGEMAPLIWAGSAAVLGHTKSVFVRFRGGKGVATSAGVFLALLPIPTAIALSVFFVVFGITRFVSLGSLLAAAALAASAVALSAPKPLAWSAVAVVFLVVYTHRANIHRLLRGTENRVDWNKKGA